MPTPKCSDPAILNLWHAIAAVAEIPVGRVSETVLLQERIGYTRKSNGDLVAWRADRDLHEGDDIAAGSLPPGLPAREFYGYLWVSLGEPADIFPIPEFAEPDRRRFNAATIGVYVSAPRAIENFLDMAHFPYVHTDILGAEPHTEVKEYDVETSIERDEVVATRCRFYQPRAAAASDEPAEVDYIYRVPHPYCSILYKSSPLDPERLDVIALFVQPVDEERSRAHMMLCLLDEDNEDKVIRRFQQTIFGQDKPILENQFPKRLPLDPRAETPIRADKSAIAYRRWLSRKGITYGVIPAPT